MTGTSLLGAAAQVCLATVLAYSSLSKVPAFGAFGDVLRRLGAGRSAAPAAALVVAGELLAAVALLAAPAAAWPRLLVALLAAGFAAAGVRALLMRERVHCNCFGAGGGGAALGVRQLVLLPGWLAAAAAAQAWAPHWSAEEGLAGLAALLLAFSARHLPQGVRAWRGLKDDRAAFAESTGIGAEDPVRAKELTLG